MHDDSDRTRSAPNREDPLSSPERECVQCSKSTLLDRVVLLLLLTSMATVVGALAYQAYQGMRFFLFP